MNENYESQKLITENTINAEELIWSELQKINKIENTISTTYQNFQNKFSNPELSVELSRKANTKFFYKIFNSAISHSEILIFDIEGGFNENREYLQGFIEGALEILISEKNLEYQSLRQSIQTLNEALNRYACLYNLKFNICHYSLENPSNLLEIKNYGNDKSLFARNLILLNKEKQEIKNIELKAGFDYEIINLPECEMLLFKNNLNSTQNLICFNKNKDYIKYKFFYENNDYMSFIENLLKEIDQKDFYEIAINKILNLSEEQIKKARRLFSYKSPDELPQGFDFYIKSLNNNSDKFAISIRLERNAIPWAYSSENNDFIANLCLFFNDLKVSNDGLELSMKI